MNKNSEHAGLNVNTQYVGANPVGFSYSNAAPIAPPILPPNCGPVLKAAVAQELLDEVRKHAAYINTTIFGTQLQQGEGMKEGPEGLDRSLERLCTDLEGLRTELATVARRMEAK